MNAPLEDANRSMKATSGSQPYRIDIEQLLAGRREVRLLCEGQEYRLQLTRNSKLILTK